MPKVAHLVSYSIYTMQNCRGVVTKRRHEQTPFGKELALFYNSLHQLGI